MDDSQRAADPGGKGDDHYQPWLRNGATAPYGGAAASSGPPRPAPLPTRPTAIIEPADDPAPPMRSAHLSADELLARPIHITAPAPGTLGLLDRTSQAIADGSDALRSAWQQGGIGPTLAKLELGRRARQGAIAIANGTRAALRWAGRASRRTGDTLGPLLADGARATGAGLGRAGRSIAGGGRAIADHIGSSAAAARQALADRRSAPATPVKLPDHPRDKAVDTGPTPSAAAGLPLFSAAADVPAPRTRKAAVAPIAAAPDMGGDDRSPHPAPPPPSAGSGSNGSSTFAANPDRPWLRHPATLALAGTALLSAGFAAGLYWTGPGVDRASTERVIHDYLLNNPEILPQAMERLQANQAAVAVNRLRSRIETPFSGAWAGAADGDVVLTMFTDYACTYCRASLADVERLLAEDRRLKVVFRELPILSPDSEPAARLALAAARRGRYMPMHRALFATRTPDAAARTSAADSLGIATGPAVTNAAQITQELQNNITLARELGFDGTPSWVVGDRMLTGAVGYEQLKSAIAQARAG